jgi:YgiT-type zinc finger domain-containing protein
MRQSKRCPVCRGKLVRKDVEKFLRNDGDTAIVKVSADVCLKCSTRLYAPQMMARIADVKNKLKNGQVENFVLTGKSYAVD